MIPATLPAPTPSRGADASPTGEGASAFDGLLGLALAGGHAVPAESTETSADDATLLVAGQVADEEIDGEVEAEIATESPIAAEVDAGTETTVSPEAMNDTEIVVPADAEPATPGAADKTAVDATTSIADAPTVGTDAHAKGAVVMAHRAAEAHAPRVVEESGLAPRPDGTSPAGHRGTGAQSAPAAAGQASANASANAAALSNTTAGDADAAATSTSAATPSPVPADTATASAAGAATPAAVDQAADGTIDADPSRRTVDPAGESVDTGTEADGVAPKSTGTDNGTATGADEDADAHTPAPRSGAAATTGTAAASTPTDVDAAPLPVDRSSTAEATVADVRPADAPTPTPAASAPAVQPTSTVAATAPAAPTPAPPPPVATQLVDHVSPLLQRGDGTHEVTIELDPLDLGRVRLEVTLDDGVVSVRVHADDPATRRLFASSINDLRASLTEAGISAGDLDVREGDAGDRDRQPSSRRPRTETSDDGRAPHGAHPRPRPSSTSALDVLL